MKDFIGRDAEIMSFDGVISPGRAACCDQDFVRCDIAIFGDEMDGMFVF